MNYRTFVVSDATAEMDPSRYENALKTLAFLFARVLTVDDVESAWEAHPNSELATSTASQGGA